VRLRERVSAQADASLREDEAHVKIILIDGRACEQHIDHAGGSAGNPMSDRALDAKFRALAEGVLPGKQVEALLRECRAVANLGNVAELARLAVP